MKERPKTRRLPGGKLPDPEHLRAHDYGKCDHEFNRLKRETRGVRSKENWPDHLKMPGTLSKSPTRADLDARDPDGCKPFSMENWNQKLTELNSTFNSEPPDPNAPGEPISVGSTRKKVGQVFRDETIRVIAFSVVLLAGLAVIAYLFYRSGGVGEINIQGQSILDAISGP